MPNHGGKDYLFYVPEASVDFNTETIEGQKKVLKMARDGLFDGDVDVGKWITEPDKVIAKAQQDIYKAEVITAVMPDKHNILKIVMYLDAVYIDKQSDTFIGDQVYLSKCDLDKFISHTRGNDEYSDNISVLELEEGLILEKIIYIEDGKRLPQPGHYIQNILTAKYEEELESKFKDTLKELDDAWKDHKTKEQETKERRQERNNVSLIIGGLFLGLAIVATTLILII